MRRRPPPNGQVPPLLDTFDSAEWSGTQAARYVAWKLARRTYAEVYGWPGGAVEMILQEREARGLRRPSPKPRP